MSKKTDDEDDILCESFLLAMFTAFMLLCVLNLIFYCRGFDG